MFDLLHLIYVRRHLINNAILSTFRKHILNWSPLSLKSVQQMLHALKKTSFGQTNGLCDPKIKDTNMFLLALETYLTHYISSNVFISVRESQCFD